jgi:membrane protease YdiL (CAAX protease family)
MGAAWIARSSGLSNMAVAHITMGVVGLGGGWSHALLIRRVSTEASWKQMLFLPVVWALALIAGAAPLFAETGTAWKMGMLTLYSFSAAGALGGMITAAAMRPLFPDAYPRRAVPCALIWSFNLGLAAVAGDLLGEGLKTFLPPTMAWTGASGIMVLIVGCGAGFSLICFLRRAEPGRVSTPIETGTQDRPLGTESAGRIYVPILILLCTPFYLNDFTNIYITDWRLWLLIDYTSVKGFPLLILLWLIHTGKMEVSAFGWTRLTIASFIPVFFLGTLTVIFLVQNGDLFLNRLPGYPSLGKMPDINSPIWRWIDLTIGLLMVGIIEELVFRGYLSTFISRYTQRPWIIIGLSAMAFGFIHWSAGLHMVILTGAAGAVFMLLYLQSRSLPAIMLAHFAFDFVDVANILPKPVLIP